MNDRTDTGLRRVLERVTVSDLARALGVTKSAVSQWERVPLERVRTVADITGLPEHVIRPDHYRPAA